MKKIILEIPIPEYTWVDAPTLYTTCLGEVSEEAHVEQIRSLIGYLKRHEDRHAIINMEYKMRDALCRELVRTHLRFVPDNLLHHYASQLSGFLSRFQPQVGYDFDKFEFESQILCNGKKIQFKTFSMLFDNEDQAIRHIAKIFTSSSNFHYILHEE